MNSTVASKSFLTPRFLDRVEQVTVVVLYAFFAYRLLPDDMSAQMLATGLILISEGAVVLFLLIRKPTEDLSMSPVDWFIAGAGTFMALLVTKSTGAPISTTLGGLLLFFGCVIHIGAKLSLNTSFGLVAANRGVKQHGMYGLVRHPMYAGYMLSHLGFVLLQPALWNIAIYAIVWTLLVLRIRAEERVLFKDPSYQELAERVPYRLVPGVY